MSKLREMLAEHLSGSKDLLGATWVELSLIETLDIAIKQWAIGLLPSKGNSFSIDWNKGFNQYRDNLRKKIEEG